MSLNLGNAEKSFDLFRYDPDAVVRDSEIPERLLEDLGLDREDEDEAA